MSGLLDMNRSVGLPIGPFQLDEIPQAGNGAAEDVERGTDVADPARREDADA